MKAPNVEFVCNDGKGLSSWQDGSLDLIYSFLVFQHLRRDWVLGYIEEAFHKLRGGGRLVFQIPIDESGMMAEPPASHPYGLRYYPREEVRKMLRDAGFDQVSRFQAASGEADRRQPPADLVFVATKQPT